MSNPNNTVILIGILVDDPKFISNRSGVEFASRFTLAVNKSYKRETGQTLTDFIPVQIKGERRMEFAHMLKKGDPVALTGTISVESYEDSNGNKVFSVFVAAENVNWTQGKPRDGKMIEQKTDVSFKQENAPKSKRNVEDQSYNGMQRQVGDTQGISRSKSHTHEQNNKARKTGTFSVEMDLDFPELPFA